LGKLKKIGIGIGIFLGIIIALGIVGSTIGNDTTNEFDSDSLSNERSTDPSLTIDSMEPSSPVQQIFEEGVDTQPSQRACIPDRVCFVSGDYLQYSVHQDGELVWEIRYTYAGLFDSPRVAVEKYSLSHDEKFGMIVGGKITNNVTTLLDFDPCCGLYAEEYVGGSGEYGYGYLIIQPSPVKITKWTEHETSADYWKDKVKDDTYNYGDFERSVIIIQDGSSIKQVIDKETGIILLLENNQTAYYDFYTTIELVDTNIIQSDSGDTSQLPSLSVVITPAQYSISRGSEQTVFIKVNDENGKPVEDVSLSATVTYASGSQQSFSGSSNSKGDWSFSWQIGGNSNTGTFNVSITATKNGYTGDIGTTSFSVTQAT